MKQKGIKMLYITSRQPEISPSSRKTNNLHSSLPHDWRGIAPHDYLCGECMCDRNYIILEVLLSADNTLCAPQNHEQLHRNYKTLLQRASVSASKDDAMPDFVPLNPYMRFLMGAT